MGFGDREKKLHSIVSVPLLAAIVHGCFPTKIAAWFQTLHRVGLIRQPHNRVSQNPMSDFEFAGYYEPKHQSGVSISFCKK